MSLFPAELEMLFSPDETQGEFLDRVVSFLGKEGAKDSLYHLLEIDEERLFCEQMERSGLQDAALARYRKRAHLLALALVDEKGGIEPKRVKAFLEGFERSGRIFYTEAASDEDFQAHLCQKLRWLVEDKNGIKKVLKFSLPLDSRYLEHLIRVALYLPQNHVLSNADIRRAVLSAWFCFLRQSVGSCFATAPAILIHLQQPDYFLNDLEELLSTSRLKRVLDGVEYVVPCSPSWGIGDLKRDLLSLAENYEVERSPGLLAGLETIDVRFTHWRDFFSCQKKKKKTLFVDEFFEEILLEEYGLSRERWHLFKNGTRFMPRVLPKGVSSTVVDPQEALCEKMEMSLKAAANAFRAAVDHPLLKTWEYTLASFSEAKMEFSRWNLYASLGMDPREKGGVAAVLDEAIEENIEQANKKIQELHNVYSEAFDQVRATESLLRNASSEQEARRLTAEYQSRVYHMRNLLEMRDEAYQRGSMYVGLLPSLLKQYDLLFPEFFQEIYDAEMFDPSIGIYEDSAAGFRLVYKHGRSDPSQWTIIRRSEEYIDALVDFFKMTEAQAIANCSEKIAAKEIPRLTSLIIHHLHSKEFLDSAMRRMKEAHSPQKLKSQAPEMLLGEKLPWAYISGGTMETLIKTYYRSPSAIFREEKWVESAEDLLTFLLETLKGISFFFVESLKKNRSRRLLMHSPTHAFLLLPGEAELIKGWEYDRFTYTWVRDELIEPSKQFYEKIELNIERADYLISLLENHFPAAFLHAWRNNLPRSLKEMTIDQLIHASGSAWGTTFIDELDAHLFLHLPLYQGKEWKPIVSKWLNNDLEEWPNFSKRIISSSEMIDVAKGCFLLMQSSLQTQVDVHGLVLQTALQQGSIAPRIIFADTNWPHFRFAFAWGAVSKKLRLFRLEPSGKKAVVMSSWEVDLNGSRRLPWAVYAKPEQYS